MSRTRQGGLVYLLVLLILAGLACVFVRPMVRRPGTYVLGDTGEAIFNICILAWTYHALGTKPLNLYNTTMFFPNSNTLAYTDNEFASACYLCPPRRSRTTRWQLTIGWSS